MHIVELPSTYNLAYQYNIINTDITSEFWDCQLIEMSVTDKHHVNKKMCLGNLYRPPSPTNEHVYNLLMTWKKYLIN